MKNFPLILALVLFLGACVKDKPQDAIQPYVQLSGSGKVYVLNEGGFGYNQASVSLYDPATTQVIEDIYSIQNNATLGDVAQSITFVNGNYYLTVNNSKKIVVCDRQLKKTGQINGLESPRYLLPITAKKAYVSDLAANAIHVVDLNTLLKTGSIPCNGWTEKMVAIYNKAFITNLRSNYLYVVNTLNDVISDSIQVGLDAGNILADKFDNIWVLSSGDAINNVPGKLMRINSLNNTVDLSFAFGANEAPGNLCMNKGKDTLYYINNDIFRMAVSANGLPPAAFIKANGKNFYGLGIHPQQNQVYAADVLDYVQRSNIYIYNITGAELSFFKAGMISNGFYFE